MCVCACACLGEVWVVLSARGGKECPIKHSEQNTWRVESYREEIHIGKKVIYRRDSYREEINIEKSHIEQSYKEEIHIANSPVGGKVV